jgi:hypothetical protein
MQESEIEIVDTNEKGWFEKIKNWSYKNWQTILVVLIVLIVGMSAYNYNRQNNTNNNSNPAAIVNNNSESSNQETDQEAEIENRDQEIADKEDRAATEPGNETIGKSDENTNKNDQKKETIISNSDNSGKTYTVTAIHGEGITHLARRALEKYLQETNEGSGLTKEHKIYIEDYLQNRTGSQKINVGHQETFSENLIKEAISNANNLSQKSLENLKKYTEKIQL